MAVHGLGIAAAADVPGAAEAALKLIDGLLEAAAGFDYRMPELFGGTPARPGGRPMPYPASCRPQAWAAASSVALLTALFGIQPDVPGGTLAIQPLPRHGLTGLTVRGLCVGEETVDLRLTEDGAAVTDSGPRGAEG
jgi:glycogen debranching enzyme